MLNFQVLAERKTFQFLCEVLKQGAIKEARKKVKTAVNKKKELFFKTDANMEKAERVLAEVINNAARSNNRISTAETNELKEAIMLTAEKKIKAVEKARLNMSTA